MNIQTIRLLVVEDSPYDARYLKEVLSGHCSTSLRIVGFEVAWAERLEDGLAHLARGNGRGFPDLSSLMRATRSRDADPCRRPDLAIVVLTGQRTRDRRSAAGRSAGVPDQGRRDKGMITRAALHAMERAKLLSSAGCRSATADRTSTAGDSGYRRAAPAWVERAFRCCSALFADLDGLKGSTTGTGMRKAMRR